jgi:hypothetical protein
MSPFAPALGDAIRPDGTLKDASEIVWSYDADDTIPFPSDNASGSHSGSSGGHAPAIVVGSVRRTTCVSRPSQRVLEALEADEAAESARNASVNRKRKAISALPDHRARKTVINVISDGDSDSDSSDGGSPSPPTEPVSDDYESLKAMADADNQVHPHSLPHFIIDLPFKFQAVTSRPQAKRMADVQIIFTREKEYINPDTRKTLDGHWCTVCR